MGREKERGTLGKCFKKEEEEEEEVGEKKEDGRILRVRSRGPCQIGCAFVPSPHVSCVCGAVFFTHGVWFYPTRAETPWVNPCVSCRREWPRPNSFFVQQHSFFFLLSSFFCSPSLVLSLSFSLYSSTGVSHWRLYDPHPVPNSRWCEFPLRAIGSAPRKLPDIIYIYTSIIVVAIFTACLLVCVCVCVQTYRSIKCSFFLLPFFFTSSRWMPSKKEKKKRDPCFFFIPHVFPPLFLSLSVDMYTHTFTLLNRK